MIAYLKLIRYQNLIIVVATQYAMRWLVIAPILKASGFDLQLSEWYFMLLVISTLCITAAGYVINDYFDRKTDLINRPKKVIVGKTIKRRTAMVLHIVLNTLGVGLGAYISFMIDLPILTFIFIGITGILWFYSTTYKRQLLLGNFIVAILTGLVPLMVLLFEVPQLNRFYYKEVIIGQEHWISLFGWVGVFGIFAAATTFVREIIKDAEDLEGDTACGRKSLPITIGLQKTNLILAALISIMIFAIGLLTAIYLLKGPGEKLAYLSIIYVAGFIVVPLFVLLTQIMKAKTREDYHNASSFLKNIMLLGIMYSLLLRFLVLSTI